MDETPVVTCFLRNRGRVLLARRSDDVGSYAGRWGAVAGHVEADGPDASARREIAEETGLGDAVTLVRWGDPVAVVDEERATRWLVHPYLFDCERRDATPNYETRAFEWVHATEIRRRATVPDLWASYDAVRPSVETVRADRDHGSARLSLCALEVLRDEAALADDWSAVADVARALRDARPTMTALGVRVDRAMASAESRTPAAVERAARTVLDAAADADERAAANAAEHLSGTVATLSRSGTALAALRTAAPERVLVAVSDPGGEGVGVAEALADEAAVTLCPDASFPRAVADADALLVGADAVNPDGSVVNKVGTYPAALAADRAGVPVVAVCARDKVAPSPVAPAESADPASVYDGDADLTVAAPLFEATPATLVTRVVTEAGALDAAGVGEVAAEHRALRAWDEG